MYDISRDLISFYDQHVRLGSDRRSDLAAKRDLNLQRLRDGLVTLGAEKNRTFNPPVDWKNQGGYAMHTLNQASFDDYDIDVGIIFRKEDLPDDPLQARQRVRDALQKKCTNFSKEPEARANAVTVWYQDGYHIDFAVYRTWDEFNGYTTVRKVEHASTTWKARDPDAVTAWFAEAVVDKSPKPEPLWGRVPKVSPGQLRRIVRYVKWFCRSRSSYCLPGGMITTALVAEVYRSDDDRDDIALYKTLEALNNRLAVQLKVYSPIDSVDITGKTEHFNEVKRLRKELAKVLPKLAVLNDTSCTRAQALSAWDWIFNHAFWEGGVVKKAVQRSMQESLAQPLLSTYPYKVSVSCKLTHGAGTPAYGTYVSNGRPLPKGIDIRFSVEGCNVPGPYQVHWCVENEGDEAQEANCLRWDVVRDRCETSTRYRGKQTMTCKVEKYGQILAASKFIVNIA